MASPKAILRRANKLKSTQSKKIHWLRVILASNDLDAESQINKLKNEPELTGRGICLLINKKELTHSPLAEHQLSDTTAYMLVLGLKV